MATIMIDTDVYSFIYSTNPTRGAPYRPHLQGQILALSFITVGEQYAGYRKKINKGEWPESSIDKLEARLKRAVIIPYDAEICRTYGNLKFGIKTANGTHRVIAPNDLWIAACAVRHSLKLMTNNRKDFHDIPGLEIICEAPPI